MRTAIATTAALLAAMTFSGAAFAAPDCTTEPKSKWMTEDAMKSMIEKMGYKDIRTFKTSGSCYEIYGHTKDGKKAEVYFNPVSGEVVQSNIEG
ncbi:MAG: PepSY domain-containing protein [Afipia sp.]|nr:PepSY domain-containing protein [Afipia sp.]